MGDFDCCRYCPPEKRHPGCAGTCPDYKKARVVYDAREQAKKAAKAEERAICRVQYNSMRLAKKGENKRQKQGRK